MRKELLEGLTEEQVKKVENCESTEEVLALAKEEGVTLTDEQLEAVSGGCGSEPTTKCKSCGAKDGQKMVSGGDAFGRHRYRCTKCGEYYWEN